MEKIDEKAFLKVLCVSQRYTNRTMFPVLANAMYKYSGAQSQSDRVMLYILYRVSTITGHTVYFTKRTGHLKMRYSQFYSLSEHNKHTKLHSQYRKN